MSNITQKTERIASALYLLTGFFPEQEPIKWKLRGLSSDLVSVALSLSSQMFKEREAARLEIRSIVLEISGLMAVAKNAGLIAEVNHDLLSQELGKYLEILGYPAGLREEQGISVLSRSFFGTEERELKPALAVEENFIKDKTLPAPKRHEDMEPYRKEKLLKEFGAVSVKKNSRQSIIIGLLKRKKEIMIKDVSPLIEGCSEKTIQRELLAMVQAGILKKIGEKRWSRYSLAHP